MPGLISWEEMGWLFPDFRDTGLIYHGTRFEHLPGIFREGLRWMMNADRRATGRRDCFGIA